MLFRTLYSISDEAPRSPTHSAAALLFLSSFDKPSIHHVQLPFLPAVTSPMGTYLTVVGPLLNLTCSDGDTSHWNKQTGSSNLNAAVYSNTSGCMASYSFTGKQVAYFNGSPGLNSGYFGCQLNQETPTWHFAQDNSTTTGDAQSSAAFCFWNSLDTTQTYTTSIITSPDPSTLLWVWAFKAFAPTDDGFALATVVPTDIEQATTASPVSPFDAAGSSNSSSSTDKSTVVQSPTQLSNPLTTPPVTGSSVSSTILSNLPSSTAVDSTVTLTASPTSMSDLQTASSPSGEVLQGVPNTVFYIGGGVVGLILFIVLLVALTSKKGDAGAQASIGRHPLRRREKKKSRRNDAEEDVAQDQLLPRDRFACPEQASNGDPSSSEDSSENSDWSDIDSHGPSRS